MEKIVSGETSSNSGSPFETLANNRTEFSAVGFLINSDLLPNGSRPKYMVRERDWSLHLVDVTAVLILLPRKI